MSESTVTPVLASDVRKAFQKSKRLRQGLSPEALKTVMLREDGTNPKGRIHPDARERFAKRNPAKEYVEGNQAGIAVEGKGVFLVSEVRKAASDAGVAVGKRGVLSAEALKAAATVL